MFKVGDRVRVVNPTTGNLCRPESFLGCEGVLLTVEADGDEMGGDVRLSSDQTWTFLLSELEPAVVPSAAPTLLDQFAMHALTGMMALSAKTNGEFYTDVVVRRCWDVANEMMKAREVQK